jgi:hypothetical protein
MRPILPIVEGRGDALAVPELIRRVLHEHEIFDVRVLTPQERGDLPKVKAKLESFLKIASYEKAPILMVLDFDCDFCECPLREREELLASARSIHIDQAFDVCFMVKEYESLFLWDEDTTRAVFPAIPKGRAFPPDPESVRDAKGWLSNALPKGVAYKTTVHQQKLTARLDLDRLRECSPSFQRFEAALLQLVTDHQGEAHA